MLQVHVNNDIYNKNCLIHNAILLDCVSFCPLLVLVDLIKCEPINKRVRKLDLCLENCSTLSCTTWPCPFSILIKQCGMLSAEIFINTDRFCFAPID